MKASHPSRYACLALCLLGIFTSLFFLSTLWPLGLACALLSLVGLNDMHQTHHVVRRNYPILGNIRYLIESDDDKLPFSRSRRDRISLRPALYL